MADTRKNKGGRPKGLPKTGGRVRGTPNKDKADLLGQIQSHRGLKTYDPVVAMAKLAHKRGVPDELRFRCHAEVAKYIRPKLKSIEHSGAIDVGISGVLRVAPVAQSTDEWEAEGE